MEAQEAVEGLVHAVAVLVSAAEGAGELAQLAGPLPWEQDVATDGDEGAGIRSHDVRELAKLLFGFGLLAVGLGQMTDHLEIRLDAYSLLAQVLPILLLASALEGGYFRKRPNAPPFDRYLPQVLLAIPLLAELAALTIVAQGHDTNLLRGTTLLGSAISAMLLIILAQHGPASTIQSDTTHHASN
jgi:hypothetical protein